jgi:prevent-host-death family protein
MKCTVPAFEARRQFGKLLDLVVEDYTSIVVERHGREVAAIVPIEEYRRMERHKQRVMEIIERTSERTDPLEEQTMALALEAVQAVRAEEAARAVREDA